MTIETKYDIGDEVWFKFGKNIFNGRIVDKKQEFYFIVILYMNYPCIFDRTESDLFPTKEELLKSL